MGQHQHHIGGGEETAGLQHQRPPPLATGLGGVEEQLLGGEGPARGQAHEDQPGDQEGQHGDRHQPAGPGEIADTVVTEPQVDQPHRHEHGRLGGGVGDGLEGARGEQPVLQGGRGGEDQREHQEQIADLGDRGVGNQELEPLLAQGHQIAEQDGRGTEPAEELGGRQRHHPRQHLEPQPHHQEPGALHHQPRQQRAGRGRRPGVCGRQPQVQRHQGGLGQQPGGHERGGDPGERTGLHAPGQEHDVEGPIGPVEQHGAEQIEHRAEQGEDQIAQGRAQGLGAPVQRDQGDGRKGEELEGDIEGEQVAREEHQVQRAPDGEQQGPEHQRPARLAHPRRGGEVRPRIDRDAQHHQGRHREHRQGEGIGPQGHAQRRGPAAQQIDQPRAGLPHRERDGAHHPQTGEDGHRRHPPGGAPAQGEGRQHPREGQHHGEHQQPALGGRGQGVHRGESGGISDRRRRHPHRRGGADRPAGDRHPGSPSPRPRTAAAAPRAPGQWRRRPPPGR